MKFLVSVIITALLAFALGLYLPWWTVALASFTVAALIGQSAGRSFLSGAAGIFLLWGLLSWIIDSSNRHVLSLKVATILPFGGSSFMLILFTAFIGFLAGGLGALSGSYFRKIVTLRPR